MLSPVSQSLFNLYLLVGSGITGIAFVRYFLGSLPNTINLQKLQAEIDQLQAQIQIARQAHQTLNTNYQTLQQTHTALEQAHGQLQQQLQALQAENYAQTLTIRTLETAQTQHLATIQALESELNTVKAELLQPSQPSPDDPLAWLEAWVQSVSESMATTLNAWQAPWRTAWDVLETTWQQSFSSPSP